ncbi:unnamed protein product [Absidia cylindrospora]
MERFPHGCLYCIFQNGCPIIQGKSTPSQQHPQIGRKTIIQQGDKFTPVGKRLSGYDFSDYAVNQDCVIISLKTGKALSRQKTIDGYHTVTIKCNIRQKHTTQYVHRVVCSTFNDRPSMKNVVDHVNGKKDDNRRVNLEFVNQRENMRRDL